MDPACDVCSESTMCEKLLPNSYLLELMSDLLRWAYSNISYTDKGQT